MYKLYYLPGACSMAIHALLNELGQPVTLTNVNAPEAKEELVKLYGRSTVPVLVDGTQTIREGAAIILHLLGKHKNSLMPASGPERASALEWLMFCNATLHPAYAKAFGALKGFQGEVKEKVLAAAITQINSLWQEVETRLARSRYLAGNEFTAADILLTVIANWSSNFEGKIKLGEKTKNLLRTVIARPAYQKALATEQVEYKVAA